MLARRPWKAMRAAADAVIADSLDAECAQALGCPAHVAIFRWRAARRALWAEALARNTEGLDTAPTMKRLGELTYESFRQ